jgi:hypothetical protein
MKTIKTCFIGAVLCLAPLALGGCGPSEPETHGSPPTIRRLTESQYRNIIRDVFGSSIKVIARFDSPEREYGLVSIGAGKADVAPSALERYDNLARSIAAQVMEEKRRDSFFSCRPQSVNMADEACAKKFLGSVGRLLYRHPLSEDELQTEVNVANTVATSRGDFYAGLEFALSGMLVTPTFLFNAEAAEPDPLRPGMDRLTAYSKAARLSFLLWNSAPDDALLNAAEKGELHTKAGISRQVDRMLASPALESGVRSFFEDMLGLDAVDKLAKDTIIYPAFSASVATDIKEQTLRTLIDLLIFRNEDYRSIFTSRHTFMSRQLAMINRVPIETEKKWVPFEFGEDDPRAGIQTQLSFLQLHSHPGKSSPTLRGKAIREILLCQPVPPPPADVNFDTFNDPIVAKTARERLTAHRANPSCAGCHKVMDPIGLTLENFDGLGQIRTTESGASIDASGELDGIEFAGGADLGKALHDNPATISCLVTRLYSYGVGHIPTRRDRAFITYLQERFAAEGYRVPALMRQIAQSDAFFAVSKPGRKPLAELKTAANSAHEQEQGL